MSEDFEMASRDDAGDPPSDFELEMTVLAKLLGRLLGANVCCLDHLADAVGQAAGIMLRAGIEELDDEEDDGIGEPEGEA